MGGCMGGCMGWCMGGCMSWCMGGWVYGLVYGWVCGYRQEIAASSPSDNPVGAAVCFQLTLENLRWPPSRPTCLPIPDQPVSPSPTSLSPHPRPACLPIPDQPPLTVVSCICHLAGSPFVAMTFVKKSLGLECGIKYKTNGAMACRCRSPSIRTNN